MSDYKGNQNEETEIIDWETAVSENGKKEKKKKKLSLKQKLIRGAVALCILVGMYLTIVYSDIPFIAKWRTIYIETAMTTNSHQWLATLFFPQSVIDEVMAKRQENLDAQANVNSTWEDEDLETPESKSFYKVYWELDTSEFRTYIKKHPNLIKNGYDSILIEDLDNKLKLETSEGDSILVLDTANHLIIIGVKGEGYQGKMAIVKNPEQVELAKSTALGSYGQEAGSFGETQDALLVMNASGFVDVDGVGTGGQVKGSLLIDGVEYGSPSTDATWKFCGMKKNNRMYVSSYPTTSVSDYRWGVEFLPALIVNGESVVDGTFGMGIQPRAAIGQAKNGDILMLVVDGRQIGYSLGCTVEDCKDIMLRYKGYQAMNLDGGSSAVMWYNGNYITSSSSVTGIGRYMPDAFIVKRAEDDEVVIEASPASSSQK
jgi:exopolysaccharide biosynthesis protein